MLKSFLLATAKEVTPVGGGNNSEYLGDNTARHELLISNSPYALIQMKHGVKTNTS